MVKKPFSDLVAFCMNSFYKKQKYQLISKSKFSDGHAYKKSTNSIIAYPSGNYLKYRIVQGLIQILHKNKNHLDRLLVVLVLIFFFEKLQVSKTTKSFLTQSFFALFFFWKITSTNFFLSQSFQMDTPYEIRNIFWFL